MFLDSVDKMVKTYFRCVTKETFTYKGVTYVPKALRMSPDLLRGYTCPVNCGGCCHHPYTLDFLPFEEKAYSPPSRMIEFSGRKIEILSDTQSDKDPSKGERCRHLNMENGRCLIHFDGKPATCDIELIRFLIFDDKPYNVVTQKLFGRGWSYPRIDGQKGALCEMLPVTKETIEDTSRRFFRMKQWADHFGLKHCIQDIIDWVESGPHSIPGMVNREFLQEEEGLFSDWR